MSRKEALSSFIQQIHGRPVVVKLNSGVDYRGNIIIIFNVILSKRTFNNKGDWPFKFHQQYIITIYLNCNKNLNWKIEKYVFIYSRFLCKSKKKSNIKHLPPYKHFLI